MKQVKSYCSYNNCPIKSCKRHHRNNQDDTVEYDLREMCDDLSKYYMNHMRNKNHKKDADSFRKYSTNI